MSKIRNFHGQVHQISLNIQKASEEYHDPSNDFVKPLKRELAEIRSELESAQTLQSSTNTELVNLRAELQEVTKRAQTSEKTFQDEIVKNRAETPKGSRYITPHSK